MAKHNYPLGELLPALARGTAIIVYAESAGCYLLTMHRPLPTYVEIYKLQEVAQHGKAAHAQRVTMAEFRHAEGNVRICQRFNTAADAFLAIKENKQYITDHWQEPIEFEKVA